MVLYYKCEGRIINLTNLNVDKIKIPVYISTKPYFQIGAQAPNVSFQAGLKLKQLDKDVLVKSTQKEVPELKESLSLLEKLFNFKNFLVQKIEKTAPYDKNDPDYSIEITKGNYQQFLTIAQSNLENLFQVFNSDLPEFTPLKKICEKNFKKDKALELYFPLIRQIAHMNNNDMEGYVKYLNAYVDYKTNLNSANNTRPKLYKYKNKEVYITKMLDGDNLIKLINYSNMFQKGDLPLRYTKELYHKNIVGLDPLPPEFRFDLETDSLKKICSNLKNVIRELNKVEDLDYFCTQSFVLLKNKLGLDDCNIEMKIANSSDGSFYDVATNTVYINKKLVKKGDKSQIFGDIACQLSYALQFIEIIRNGHLENYPKIKNAIAKTNEGKCLLYYCNLIGKNKQTMEESKNNLIDWNNFITKQNDYNKFDKKSELLIAQKADKYKVVAQEEYNKLTNKNKKPRTVSVREIKKLFNNNKIDTNNDWYKEIKNFLKKNRTDNYKIDISPKLTAKDYEVLAMLVNINDGKYFDMLKKTNENDKIPNIQKLAIFARTMQLTHQTLEYANFDENQWDIIIQDIINKPQDLIIPVLKYKFDSNDINNALEDISNCKDTEILKTIEKIDEYMNIFKVKKPFNVYRGEMSFSFLKNHKTKDGRILSQVIEEFTAELKNDIKNDRYDQKKVDEFIRKYFCNENGEIDFKINQKRYLSTAFSKDGNKRFEKCATWEIEVPPNTKGASIEGFNIERVAEAEFLVARNSMLSVEKIYFAPMRQLWFLKGRIEQ